SVVDTTGEDALHRGYTLHFPENTRVARLTQLAVLQSFRGLGMPRQLIREAIHRIVQPHRFDFTWLLFHASRLCRVLTRDERRWSGRDNPRYAVTEIVTAVS